MRDAFQKNLIFFLFSIDLKRSRNSQGFALIWGILFLISAVWTRSTQLQWMFCNSQNMNETKNNQTWWNEMYHHNSLKFSEQVAFYYTLSEAKKMHSILPRLNMCTVEGKKQEQVNMLFSSQSRLGGRISTRICVRIFRQSEKAFYTLHSAILIFSERWLGRY